MAKIFKKLFVGDTVATSGNKCFKKLTTEDPNSIVGTWHFNNKLIIDDSISHKYFAVSFTVDYDNVTVTYPGIFLNINTPGFPKPSMSYYKSDGSCSYVYANDVWLQNNGSEKINITSEPTNSEFITWLKANAVKQS